jgi:hypothetical protein
MQWVSAPDFTAAEAFLRQNNHMLGDDYDSALDEAFLVLDPARTAALKDIRARLRFAPPANAHTADPRHEVHAGDTQENDTAHPHIYDLAEHFLEVDLDQRIALLAEHGEELRGDTVGRHLRARKDSPRASAAVSLIELSRIPLHTDVAATALDEDQANTVLARIAEHHDTKTLRQAASRTACRGLRVTPATSKALPDWTFASFRIPTPSR